MNTITETTIDQNKSLYRRFIQTLFNEGRLDQLDEFISPAFVVRAAPPGTPEGPAAVQHSVTLFRTAFPDLKITIEELIGEGDKVSARATLRGTHQAPIFGIPATGKTVTVTGLTMIHLADGQIVESLVRNDVPGLMRQLKS
jgi:steroid delta-isomerase-like uncharacterized protein